MEVDRFVRTTLVRRDDAQVQVDLGNNTVLNSFTCILQLSNEQEALFKVELGFL